jgi:hypothetical protein
MHSSRQGNGRFRDGISRRVHTPNPHHRRRNTVKHARPRPRLIRSLLLGSALAVIAAPAAAQQTIRLPATDEPLALRPTTLYSIGKAEGHEWETFGNVVAVTFDAHDNLFVLDGGSSRVFVFDRDGRHVRSFGRRGQGPGEFGFPMGISVLRDGEIIVGDVMRGALQRFQSDGTPIASLETGEFRPTGRIEPHPQGGIVALAGNTPGRMESGGAPPPRQRELRWWAGDGATSRTIFSAPPQQQNAMGTEQIRVHRPPAFSPELQWAVLPGGDIAINTVEEYRIQIVGSDGQLRRIIERPIAPRRVTEKDREAYRELQSRSQVVLGGGGSGPDARAMAQLQASMANVEFNDRIPVIRRLTADPFGRLWLMRFTEVGDSSGPIDLIAADGSYMGTLPAQPMPSAFSRTGRIAYIERDDLGVQRIVVRQVPHATN